MNYVFIKVGFAQCVCHELICFYVVTRDCNWENEFYFCINFQSKLWKFLQDPIVSKAQSSSDSNSCVVTFLGAKVEIYFMTYLHFIWKNIVHRLKFSDITSSYGCPQFFDRFLDLRWRELSVSHYVFLLRIQLTVMKIIEYGRTQCAKLCKRNPVPNMPGAQSIQWVNTQKVFTVWFAW